MGGFILFNIISILLPVILIIYLKIRYKITLKVIIIGLLTFFIPQILIRIPILQIVAKYAPSLEIGVAFKIILPLSAGLVEVLGDYIAFRYFLKKDLDVKSAIGLGLAHGLCENLFLLYIIIMTGTTVGVSYIGSYERVVAIIGHLAFGLFAYYAVVKKEVSYLILGILLHGLTDLIISFSNNVILDEGWFTLITIFSVVIIVFVLREDRKTLA